jgi:hypothetical protein
VSVRDLFSGAISDSLTSNHWNMDTNSETDEALETDTNWETEIERSFVITPVELEKKLKQFIDNMVLQHACQLHHVDLSQFPKERMLRVARDEFQQVAFLAANWHVMVGTLVDLLALRHVSRFHLEGAESGYLLKS